MPDLETDDCHQDAVLWERLGTDINSEPVLKYPRQVRVRWVDAKRQTTNKQGQTVTTDAEVAIACHYELIGSIMWLGGMHEIEGTATPPTPLSNLYEVVSEDSALDVKGVNVRREMRLKRWNNTLPVVQDEV